MPCFATGFRFGSADCCGGEKWQRRHAGPHRPAGVLDASAIPLAAADLLSHGVDKGPRLGEMLRAAEAYWVAQDFVPSKEALIDSPCRPADQHGSLPR